MSGNTNQLREARVSSKEVRERILVAAATEFAALGFEGASTRVIAEGAGVHQAQIGYHVGSKDDLWRAAVDFLFTRLREYLDRALPSNPDVYVPDSIDLFADIVRLHVQHTAKHPELSRIMLMESAKKSPRVDWLLKNHVRPTLAALEMVWADVQATGRGKNMNAGEVFMMMIALSPMPFAQAGIMRPLLGANRCTAEQHSAAMIEWILQ